MFLDEYSKLTNECKISKLGETYFFYYADENNLNLLVNDCIEIDIRSAFPSICRILFGKENEIVKEIYKKETKLERNIFISTRLKDNIPELNDYCKYFIFLKIFNNYDNINILEYKKDSLLFSGEISVKPKYDYIENYFEDQEIEFKLNNIKKYIRFSKTSVYQNDNIIDVKGKYKDPPVFLKTSITDIINENKIFDNDFLNNILKFYKNELYLDLFKFNHLIDKVKHHYTFGDNSFLDRFGKFSKNINDIDPTQVLFKFLYPILTLLKQK
jgi:hypothetical protein